MKTISVFLLSICAIFAADKIYNYDSYWLSFDNRVFEPRGDKNGFDFNESYIADYPFPISEFAGEFQGKKYHLILDGNQTIYINDRAIDFSENAIEFKRDDRFAPSIEQMLGSYAYLAKDFICFEAYYTQASGTSVRYHYVFLIDLNRLNANQKSIYILPTFQQSCLSIRKKNNRVYFDEVSYQKKLNKDNLPIGIIFKEYYIDGEDFKPSGKQTKARFLDPENVYEFRLE